MVRKVTSDSLDNSKTDEVLSTLLTIVSLGTNKRVGKKVKRNLTSKRELEAIAEVLRQERQELLALNAAKDEFISLVSHQLRTPATAVKQYIGMLLEGFFGEIDPQHEDILRRAYNSNERQLRTVNDMLLVARVDANKIKIQLKPVDIAALIRDVVEEQTGIFDKRNQKVIVKAPKKLVANVDARYFRMVVDNVLENASKYTYESGTITIQLTSNTKTFTLTVNDTGVGIAQSDFDKLFKKFSRIHNPLSVEAEGSGLGLYWSERIIAMHHGELAVDSKLGKGTTFSIKVPLKSNK